MSQSKKITVEEWLRRLYSTDTYGKLQAKTEVPPYEKNNVTNEILSDIQQANSVADKVIDEEVKMMKVLKKEHTAEITRFTNILGPLRLDLNHLPDEIANLARTVAVARINFEELEELQEPSHPDETIELVDVSDDLLKGLQNLQKLENIRDSLREIRANELQERGIKKKETEFLSKKTHEYASHIRSLEKRLDAVGYTPEISHGALVRRSNEIKAERDKLEHYKKKLEIYSDLSPDPALARMQVQNLKDEVARLEKEIADNLTNIHTG